MNEIKDTKCPLCGAPVNVRITDDPHLWETKIGYQYKEPPQPAPTIQGYEISDLQAVATLLRQDLITPEDLHDLKSNFERAFVMVAEIQRRDMERQFAVFQERCLDPMAFAGVKPDLSAMNITQKQFDDLFNDDKEGKA